MWELSEQVRVNIVKRQGCGPEHGFAFLVLVAVLLVWGCESSPPAFKGLEYDNAAPADDFALTDQHGDIFRLSEHNGRVVLISFGYGYCPDACPMTLSTWSEVHRALEGEADLAKFVFVTVDPQRDTPDRLRAHLAIFNSAFFGLGGSLEALQPVYDSFGVYRKRVEISSGAAGYLMDHTTRTYLIDQTGRLRLSYRFDIPPEDIAHDIRLLLK